MLPSYCKAVLLALRASCLHCVRTECACTSQALLKKEKVASATTASAKSGSTKPSNVPVEPLTPQELKEMLAKSKQSEDDDCLMCGS